MMRLIQLKKQFVGLALFATVAGCSGSVDPVVHHVAHAGSPVTAVAPVNTAPAVALNWKVLATFGEDMDGASLVAPGVFTVTGPLAVPVPGTVTYDVVSRTAVFSPNDLFASDSAYRAMISTGAMTLAGVPLSAPFVWTFSTALTLDVTAPLVSFTAPADGDTAVATNRKIVATFNEAVDPLTITAASLSVAGPDGAVAGVVTYAAASDAATFTPATVLATSSTYTVTVRGVTAVADLAGNLMAADHLWTFTTAAAPDLTPPRASSTNPANLAVGVALDKQVNASFTEAMDPLSITTANFTLMDGATPVVGTVAYDAINNIAVFAPLSPLTAGTSYTAAVSVGARDLAGNGLEAGLTSNPWSFTTAPAAVFAHAIDLKLAGPFAIAAAAGMTNTPTAPVTTINGNILLSMNSTCNAVAWPACGGTSPIVNGVALLGADAAALAAKADLLAAYLSVSPASLPGAIVLGCGTIGTGGAAGALIGCAGNATLPPGVYVSATGSTIGLTGVLTLDGQGDANAQFVFQVPSALTTAAGAPGLPGSQIVLINGAKASNVWWQVGSSATIGTYARFQGNVLASTSITMGTGARSCGRMMAGAVTASGAITFDSNVVSVPGNGCPL